MENIKQKITELVSKIKIVDLIIIAGVLIALVVGFFTYSHFRQTADKQIEAVSKITFQVYMRGVTFTGEKIPFEKGEKTFISIRNVPYTDLEIVDVRAEKKKVVLPVFNNAKKVVVVEDVSQAYLFDVVVTLVDEAKITKDGAVVGGNKIKIGLPITLEGDDYKLNGTVSDVKVAHTVEGQNILNTRINTTDDVQ